LSVCARKYFKAYSRGSPGADHTRNSLKVCSRRQSVPAFFEEAQDAFLQPEADFHQDVASRAKQPLRGRNELAIGGKTVIRGKERDMRFVLTDFALAGEKFQLGSRTGDC
jgi:hypothetical protein